MDRNEDGGRRAGREVSGACWDAAGGQRPPRRSTDSAKGVPLNSLQKSIDLTPRAPRAGPIGGLAVAFPAGTTSLAREAKISPIKKAARAEADAAEVLERAETAGLT